MHARRPQVQKSELFIIWIRRANLAPPLRVIDVDAAQAQESRGPVQCAPYSGYVEQRGQLKKAEPLDDGDG